ncbi:NAD(P)-dependent alcohol dehydrogenase [Achromobacter pestifer]|uniref:NAD(P)-dependent alcohol dehydrogenase n=1 Tax=Achromobacter pestifer TaxID=1353889 RepID=A0A7D4ICN7_9BURK|nr:NAD(P)-dependent alcohol dehydrogenase [Achromobacter pestifer]QKH38902.1 NAD(P)-dependent alcohol dehydrogenase [Achromobacter pestifer]
MMTEPSMLKIRAAVTREKGAPFSIEDAYLRPPKQDEVRVRIVAAGICHTDMIIRDQYYPVPLPAVLGHEGAGVVESVGPLVRDLKPGDRVVLTYGSCGRCLSCAKGLSSYCKDFFSLNFGGSGRDGEHALSDAQNADLHDHFFSQSSFATYCIARENNAIKVPPEAPLELLGPLGCGFQTGAGAVINTLRVAPGASFVSFGAGAVGLSAIMAAKATGATTIVAVDVVASRLQLALEVGATHALHAKQLDAVEAIRELTAGGADYALETTGVPAVATQAIASLGELGAVGIVGASHLGTQVGFDVNDLLIKGKTIRGICEGDSVPRKFIPDLIALHMQQRFPIDKLIRFYDFSQINEAAADSESGKTLKPVLLMPA